MITPTIGRKVWYWPLDDSEINWVDVNQACDATVVMVNGTSVSDESRVNLLIVDHLGHPHFKANVLLRQEEDSTPHYSYAEWMPYQNAQAKK